MKILFAIKTLHLAAGGAERVLCVISSELAKNGHDITLVCFDHPDEPPFYPVDKQVKQINLGLETNKKSLKNFIHRISTLRQITLRETPQIAVGFMHSMFIPLSIAMAGTHIPVIGSEHTTPEYYRERFMEYVLLLATAPLLSGATVLSESIRKRYPAILRKRMFPVSNPVICPANPEPMRQTPRERHILLSVGRLDQSKDHATLLHAFSRIVHVFPDWELRIIGEGPLRNKLESLVKSLHLEHKVMMPGLTSDIAREYQKADVFVISSLYESFGLATAEAMSFGLPVIGFADCPGTNELIRHGQNGILSDSEPDRVSSLSRDLHTMLSNQTLRQNFGKAGKSFINQHYSPEHTAHLWEQYLRQFIK